MIDIRYFSDNLKILYNDTSVLFEKISIEIVDNFEDDSFGDTSEVMGSQSINNNEVIIKIHENWNNEYVISHELLHAYFIGQNYPDHIYHGKFNESIRTLMIARQSIYNTVLHKLIIREQQRREINIDEELNQQIQNILLTNVAEIKKDSMVNPGLVLKLFDLLVLYDFRKEEFEKFLIETCPREYKFAKRLANICLQNEYDNPFKTRQIIVKVFKKFDLILKELGLPVLHLNKWIEIGFVPRKYQLNSSLENTFFIEETIISDMTAYRLISKVDDQLSYVVAKTHYKLDEMRKMLLEDFYKIFNIKYTLS
ncbi:hypothetical protein [Jeotgalibacillus campisalis]|uniref:Uncharacterized protein n=1 Tax=Jeotgalibacillus campisalis TaxID=220754 RepID=A0A0C2R7C4_9BACL|nr:hypothetical protein [Jeotgalibacillus campisalis]KIL46145.1 hypothetical protein KR50_28200 [Jeotgalibacillus campisalis]